jgi:hypothetical protein
MNDNIREMNSTEASGVRPYYKVQSMTQLRGHFAVSVASLLLLTAIAKLISLAQKRPFLRIPDGVFPFLITRDVLAIAVLLEITVAAIMFFKRNDSIAVVACSWLVVMLVFYRLLAKALFVRQPCHCLGGLFDWIRLPRYVLDAIPVVLLYYMGVGSIIFLFSTKHVNRQ